jgi:hypothetical protein
MEAVIISEASASFYETTRRNIQEDCHLHGFFLLFLAETWQALLVSDSLK